MSWLGQIIGIIVRAIRDNFPGIHIKEKTCPAGHGQLWVICIEDPRSQVYAHEITDLEYQINENLCAYRDFNASLHA